ncbi:MAG: hypothetical protein RMM08_10980 [Armatimonadota bacterium]|nr:hypothetical protein [Armatimonadota bacterium]
MERTYEAVGTTEDGVTIVLETPIPVRGRVKVWVDTSPTEPRSALGSRDAVLDNIHERQRARGHQPMSAEEIEAYIRETRCEDDNAAGLPG